MQINTQLVIALRKKRSWKMGMLGIRRGKTADTVTTALNGEAAKGRPDSL